MKGYKNVRNVRMSERIYDMKFNLMAEKLPVGGFKYV